MEPSLGIIFTFCKSNGDVLMRSVAVGRLGDGGKGYAVGLFISNNYIWVL